MSDEDYLGKLAVEIPTETLEKLLKEGYSVSPRSGRLRKKIRIKRKKAPFSKKKLNKLIQKIGWIVLLIIFLVSLVMIVPHIGDNSRQEKLEKKSKK
jgi:hypothetical protein